MVQKLLKAIRRTIGLWKIILIFWIMNLLISILFLIPYLRAFDNFFSDRLATNILADRNFYFIYAEFYYYMKQAVDLAVNWVRAGAFIHWGLFILLSGGILHFYLHREPVTFRKFREMATGFAWKMFRIMLLYPFVILAGIILGIIIVIPLMLLMPSGASEPYYFTFFLTAVSIVGIILLVCFMLLDLTRLRIIQNTSGSILREFLAAFRFFILRPFTVFGAYLLAFFLWIISLVLYWTIQQYIPENSIFLILVHFLLMQLFLFIQIGLRWARFGILASYMADQKPKTSNDFLQEEQNFQQTSEV